MPDENVWDYPRPPALEKTQRHLRVIWVDTAGQETVVADTHSAYRVLETSHPPTYYLPPSSLVDPNQIKKTHKHSFCEWKGNASYFTFQPPGNESKVENRIWTYESPTKGFLPIKDHLSFYASSSQTSARQGQKAGWKCEVDGEIVVPQEGDFYGGWVHKGIVGKMKGARGTEFW